MKIISKECSGWIIGMILIIGAQFRFGFAEIEYTDVVDQTVVTPPFDCIQIDFACNRIDGYGIVNTSCCHDVCRIDHQIRLVFTKNVTIDFGTCDSNPKFWI